MIDIAENDSDESRANSILNAWAAVSSTEDAARFRQSERHSFRTKFTLIALSIGPDAVLTAYGRDISSGGLSFGSRRPFQLEELLAIRLPRRLVFCQVRQTRYVSRGIHGVGVMFLKVLEADAATPIPPEWVQQAGGRMPIVK